jgi:peptidoglycan/LPS O-acetylase OafA/YrhL
VDGSTGKQRLVELESLRGVAASSILLFHCWLLTSAAALTWNLGPLTGFVQPLQSGVTLFFVLSGFLLYRPVVEAVLDGRRPLHLSRYLRNRALRILPAYWCVLLVTGLVLQVGVVRMTDGGAVAGPLIDPSTLAADFFLVQTYHADTIWTGVVPAWSLTVEVAFYLVLPLLALLAGALARTRGGAARAAVIPIVLILGVGFLGKILVPLVSPGPGRAVGASWHSVLDRSFLTHADLFGFGMAAAFVYVLWERRSTGPPSFIANGVTGRVLAYVGLPTVISGYYFLPPYLYDSLVALFSAILLLRLVSPHAKGRGAKMLRHRWAAAWGRVSYSVFLWNFPVFTFLAAHGLASDHGAVDFLRNLVIGTVAIGALSFLTYRFVEAPALALKRGRAPRTEAPAAPAVTA